MKTVSQLLQAKGDAVWSVGPDTTMLDALRVMAEHDIGAVLVMDGDEVLGILSERDYARKVALQGRSSRDTPVRELMTARVVFVRPTQAIDECMALMTDRHIRHLPVMEDRRLIGVISIGDVVKAIISDQQFMLEQLEQYITQ